MEPVPGIRRRCKNPHNHAEFLAPALNAPKAFNLALLRHQSGAVDPRLTTHSGGQGQTSTNTFHITVNADERPWTEVVDEIEREATRRKARGGMTRLQLAVT
jgi:hypothetical protein